MSEEKNKAIYEALSALKDGESDTLERKRVFKFINNPSKNDEIRKKWKKKLILKGILDSEDAIIASKTGADAIIVSNHGGRQLDGAPSSIKVLPEIVDAVGRKIEIHIDGGIRSGQDVVKALCLGAKGVYIGRAFLYGLGAMGKKGVFKSLDIIKNELDKTMAFCGRKNVEDLDKSNLYVEKPYSNY